MRSRSHYRSAVLVALILAGAGVTPGAGQRPTAEDLVSQVGKNVLQSWGSRPDFVCSERITSHRLDSKGKIKDPRVVESVFTSVMTQGSMTERREISAIDGRTASKNAKMPKLAFSMDGIATNGLSMIFAAGAHTHSVAEDQSGHDPSMLKIEFATRPGQTTMTGNLSNGAGSALIDLTAMQVRQFERRTHDAPNPVTLAGTFEPVRIGEQEYWLPKTVKAEMTVKSEVLVFTAEYWNCRKFEVSTKLNTLP
jgi:hypothetical protein